MDQSVKYELKVKHWEREGISDRRNSVFKSQEAEKYSKFGKLQNNWQYRDRRKGKQW